MQKTKSGFTIVELLIVIVVVGTLAAITVVAYNGVQERAQLSKTSQDLSQLKEAIVLARIQQDRTLASITGHGCSGCECKYGQTPTDALPYNELPKSHDCWVGYYTTLDRIGSAANVELSPLKQGDSWGNPYFIDENEGTAANPCHYRDSLYSVGESGRTDGDTHVGGMSIDFYSTQCG